MLASIPFTIVFSGCTLNHSSPDGPPPYHVDANKIHDAVPKYESKSRYGNSHSYVALGKRYYVLASAEGYDRRGIASWYGTKFDGKMTANHERYDMLGMTAASPELPIPCYARITNLENGHSIIVRVNDRGPFAPHRILDLSYVAAKKLGFANKGTTWVEVKTINVLPPSHHTHSHYIIHHPPSPHYAVHRHHNPHQVAHKQKRHRTYLQVGVFSSLSRALHLKHQLAPWTRYPIKITLLPTHHHPIFYRVRIGPLPNSNVSKQLFKKLHRHGLQTALTVITDIP